MPISKAGCPVWGGEGGVIWVGGYFRPRDVAKKYFKGQFYVCAPPSGPLKPHPPFFPDWTNPARSSLRREGWAGSGRSGGEEMAFSIFEAAWANLRLAVGVTAERQHALGYALPPPTDEPTLDPFATSPNRSVRHFGSRADQRGGSGVFPLRCSLYLAPLSFPRPPPLFPFRRRRSFVSALPFSSQGPILLPGSED